MAIREYKNEENKRYNASSNSKCGHNNIRKLYVSLRLACDLLTTLTKIVLQVPIEKEKTALSWYDIKD